MGPGYKAIASFVHSGPAFLTIALGTGAKASFVVEHIAEPTPEAPALITLFGPLGASLCLQEEEITYVQPSGPQEGARLFIALPDGASLELMREP